MSAQEPAGRDALDVVFDVVFNVVDHKLDGTIGLQFKGRQALVWLDRKEWERMKSSIRRGIAQALPEKKDPWIHSDGEGHMNVVGFNEAIDACLAVILGANND